MHIKDEGDVRTNNGLAVCTFKASTANVVGLCDHADIGCSPVQYGKRVQLKRALARRGALRATTPPCSMLQRRLRGGLTRPSSFPSRDAEASLAAGKAVRDAREPPLRTGGEHHH